MRTNSIDEQLETTRPIIAEIVRKHTRREQAFLREELEQAVLIALWSDKLKRFDPSRGTLRTFVSAVASNIVRDELRRLQSKHRQAIALVDDVPAADHDQTELELAQAIQRQPSAFLTPALADAFRVLQSHPDRTEAARILGLTPKSYRVQMTRLRERLKAIFSEDIRSGAAA